MSNTWLKSAVFYQIYPNSFMDGNGDGYGDFAGITGKLDYVKALGATAIWLCPHYDSPFMDGGYDVRDYFKAAERFGGDEGFDELISSAHALGLKVIVDLVAGHASERNADFIKSGMPVRNDMWDRFIWTDSIDTRPSEFYYVYGRHDRNGNYIVNYFPTQPAFNYGFNRIDQPTWQQSYTADGPKRTREWLKSVVRFWLDRGCDGFRADMADSLVKNDGERNEKPATSEIWREIGQMMESEYPDTVLISEWSDPQAVRGAGFDADFMLDHDGNPYNRLVRADDAYFAGGDAKAFADGFAIWFESVKDGGHIALSTCNHDMPRLAPRYSPEQLRLIYSTLFTLPCVPFLYYGDEIGMKYIKDLPSVECGFARTGSRTPMQWAYAPNAGFSAAEHTFLPVECDKTLNVAAQLKDKKSLLNFVKSLLTFRKSRSEFIGKDLAFEYAEGNAPLCYSRGKLLCIVNPLSVKQQVPLTVHPKSKTLFGVGKGVKIKKTGIDVSPLSFTVLEKL